MNARIIVRDDGDLTAPCLYDAHHDLAPQPQPGYVLELVEIPGYTPAQDARLPFDLDGAKKLLEEAGWVDSDGDGYLDPNDACPLEPEDFDAVEEPRRCPVGAELVVRQGDAGRMHVGAEPVPCGVAGNGGPTGQAAAAGAAVVSQNRCRWRRPQRPPRQQHGMSHRNSP